MNGLILHSNNDAIDQQNAGWKNALRISNHFHDLTEISVEKVHLITDHLFYIIILRQDLVCLRMCMMNQTAPDAVVNAQLVIYWDWVTEELKFLSACVLKFLKHFSD